MPNAATYSAIPGPIGHRKSKSLLVFDSALKIGCAEEKRRKGRTGMRHLESCMDKIFQGSELKKKEARMKLLQDAATYKTALAANNVDLCVQIEQRYGLDGYPPNIVMKILGLVVEGWDVGEAIDAILNSCA